MKPVTSAHRWNWHVLRASVTRAFTELPAHTPGRCLRGKQCSPVKGETCHLGVDRPGFKPCLQLSPARGRGLVPQRPRTSHLHVCLRAGFPSSLGGGGRHRARNRPRVWAGSRPQVWGPESMPAGPSVLPYWAGFLSSSVWLPLWEKRPPFLCFSFFGSCFLPSSSLENNLVAFSRPRGLGPV